ncbi:MAG: hypothetical protein ACRYFS_22380 [Janthinobacterium lividum]
MELTATEKQHRERVISLILGAKTLADIIEAKHMLQKWVTAHPEDLGITDGFDHLAMSRSIAESREVAQKQAA